MASTKWDKVRKEQIDNFKHRESGTHDDLKVIPTASVIVNKEQPRKLFKEDKLQELADSIKESGLIQPIIVEEKYGDNGILEYHLIAGERRYRAVKLLGSTNIQAIVRKNVDKADFQSIVENNQRENLTVLEEALAIKKVMDERGLTQKAIAKTLGKSERNLRRILSVLKLDDSIQELASSELTLTEIESLSTLSKNEQVKRMQITKEAKEDGVMEEGTIRAKKDSAGAKRVRQKFSWGSKTEKEGGVVYDIKDDALIEKIEAFLLEVSE